MDAHKLWMLRDFIGTNKETLAENNYSFNSTKRKHVHLNIDGSGMRWPWKVADSI